MPSFGNLLERPDVHEFSMAHRDLLKQSIPEVDHPEIVDKSTFIGVEVEVEGIQSHPARYRHLWEAKGDNSLREGGVEYVSPPMKGDTISRMVSLLFLDLPKDASFSPRTSIHVHINCLDLVPEQITRFVLLYLLFEKVLYRFIGRDRERNIFCVPLQDTWRVGTLFNDLQKKLHKPHAWKLENENTRYMGINLASLYVFGTIEFRQLHGTRDREKVINWINLLLSIKQYACLVETKPLIERILALNTNSQYRVLLMDVFKHLVPLFNQRMVDSDMERGVYAIKYSVLADKYKVFLKNGFSRESPAYKWNVKQKAPVREETPILYDEEIPTDWVVVGTGTANLAEQLIQIRREDQVAREQLIENNRIRMFENIQQQRFTIGTAGQAQGIEAWLGVPNPVQQAPQPAPTPRGLRRRNP